MSSEKENYFITGRGIVSSYYNLKNLEKDWSSYEVIENNNCPDFYDILDPQEKKPTAFNVSSVIQLHNFFRDFQVLYTNWRRNICQKLKNKSIIKSRFMLLWKKQCTIS